MNFTTKIIFIVAMLVLFVVFFLGIYSNITPEAVREDFRERLYSADLALTIESMEAIRRDVNAVISYTLPAGLNAIVQPHTVLVYEEDPFTGEEFGFTINPEYTTTQRFETEDDRFYIGKVGDSLTISDSYVSKRDAVLCPDPVQVSQDISVNPVYFPDAASYLVNSFPTIDYSDSPSGGVHLSFLPARAGVRIYVSNNDASVGLGCRIMKAFIRGHQFANVNVIPIHSQIFDKDDPRRYLGYGGTNLLVAFNPQEYSEFVIANAISEGFVAYGVV
jgi:hypothetical protein